MTNKEKFIEVFGEELQRQYATKSWWEQEYVPPMSEEKKCGSCEYLGAQTGEFLVDIYGTMRPLCVCENSKSMYKSCLEIATACKRYEKKNEVKDGKKKK